jgi:leucine-rich repeat protein SHOC2
VAELPSSFAKLTSLRSLILDSNASIELPDYIGGFTQLEKLKLCGMGPERGRELKVLPEWIGNFKGLTMLCVPYTKITRLPGSLAQCRALEFINIAWTDITELPEWMRYFSRLYYLNISGSKITALSAWLEELPALTRLDISYTKIKTIPPGLLKRAEAGRLKIEMDEEELT